MSVSPLGYAVKRMYHASASQHWFCKGEKSQVDSHDRGIPDQLFSNLIRRLYVGRCANTSYSDWFYNAVNRWLCSCGNSTGRVAVGAGQQAVTVEL
jgi:hypothetical protein